MNTSIQRSAAIAVIASIALFASAQAHAKSYHTVRYKASPVHYAADGRLVDVSIRVDGGDAPLFFKPGTRDRHYFQAFKGRNYSVVVRNTTGQRVGVLIAVDGLNVVNGERSHLSRNESMYVLDPWESAEIQGWRTSLRDVRRFVFTDEQRSYAERTGQANGDMGWIRVLAFREDRPLSWIPNTPRVREQRGGHDRDDLGANEAPAPSTEGLGDAKARRSAGETEARGMAPESNPGTGWGSRQYDPVQRTQFRAARSATDRLTFRYEYASGLQALGIYPSRDRLWEREHGQLGFAKPPRW